MAPQVLIVGAGITGSMLALLAKDMGLSVRVLEKSRGAGGRMATHSFRRGDRSTPILANADLGAQYITTRSSPEHPFLGPLYKRLTDAGILIPFTGEVAGPNPYGAGSDIRHFAAPKGMRSIAEYFLESSSVAVDWGVAVEDLVLSEKEVAVSIGADSPKMADTRANVVVLTQPVLQVLGASKFGMRGSFLAQTDEKVMSALRQVEYSARFAVAYFFDKSEVSWPFSWTCHYFDKGDVRYVAHDTARRGAKDEPFMAVLVHSGVPLGMKLADEEERCGCLLLSFLLFWCVAKCFMLIRVLRIYKDPFPTAAARMQSELEQKLPELPWAAAEAEVETGRRRKTVIELPTSDVLQPNCKGLPPI